MFYKIDISGYVFESTDHQVFIDSQNPEGKWSQFSGKMKFRLQKLTKILVGFQRIKVKNKCWVKTSGLV